MKFSVVIILLVLYSLVFLAIPIHHLISNRDLMQPALKVSIDSLSTIIGFFGLFTCGVLLGLHRRLGALEKLLAAKNQQS